MTTNILSFLNTDIAKKFEANFRTQKATQNTQSNFSEFIASAGSTIDAVRGAFVWSATPEGNEFWRTISYLWMRFLVKGGESIPENQDINPEALKLLI